METGANVTTVNWEDIPIVDGWTFGGIVDPIVSAHKEVQTLPFILTNLLDELVESNFNKEELVLSEKDYRMPAWGRKVLVEDVMEYADAHLAFWEIHDIKGKDTALSFVYNLQFLPDSFKWKYQVHRDYLMRPSLRRIGHFLFDPVKGDKNWLKVHRPSGRAVIVHQ